MKIANHRSLIAALGACFALLVNSAAVVRAEIRTLNLDFGNSDAYVGGGGVLSSPGGTHWNPVTVTSFPPGSGISIQFSYTPLLDEFGQTFDLGTDPIFGGSFPDLSHNFSQGYETVSFGTGPLNDGVHLSGESIGFLIRELSTNTPVDVVVYFNNLAPAAPQQSVIQINPFSGGPPVASTVGAPTGLFPGLEGRDYLRFSNLMAAPTTIGIPTLPGITISVPPGSVANIAAIQVRGEFVRTPEPDSLALILTASAGALSLRRKGWRC